jgi:hypothetical protein
MNINFFDTESINHLYPLTLTRPAADLRVGILTIAEKWKNYLLAESYGYITKPHLSTKFAACHDATIFINGQILPSLELVDVSQKMEY